ncbi:MAG: hypothetical protein H0X24_06380 [Ktedonobacterales bacterium]|nr:hypothetical protein [Ktedonobacterales bacterium]
MRRSLIGVVLGLAVFLAACGSRADTGTVQITLSDFAIKTSQTQFTAGKSYHFVVKNTSQSAHEFMIMPQMANMGAMSMDDAHQMALAMVDMVGAGETKTLDYTFTGDTSMPGMGMTQALEFDCMFSGHYDAGMHAAITVKS